MPINSTLVPAAFGNAATVGLPLANDTAGVVLRSRNWGGNVLFRTVSSLTEALACGGVLIFKPGTGECIGFIGQTARQWIEAGGQAPLMTIEFGVRIASEEKVGFDPLVASGPANAYEYNSSFYHAQPSGQFMYLGIISAAESGFLCSTLNNVFFTKPVWALTMPGAAPGEYAREMPGVDCGGVWKKTYPNAALTDSVAFMVTQIPFFESFGAHLDRVYPRLLSGTEDTDKWLRQAWAINRAALHDGIPVLRTIWAWHNGKVHHGPGAQRAYLGPSLMLNCLNYAYENQDDANCKAIVDLPNFMYWGGFDQNLQPSANDVPPSALRAAVDSSSAKYRKSKRVISRIYGVLPYGPSAGAITLPNLLTLTKAWEPVTLSFPYPGIGGANNLEDVPVSGVSLKAKVEATMGITAWPRRASNDTAVLKVVSLPNAALLGTIGTSNAAVLHRHSLVGQYMRDDGTMVVSARAEPWTTAMFGFDMETEAYGAALIRSQDAGADLATLQTLASNGVTVNRASNLATVTWQAWGADIFDDTYNFCSLVFDHATKLAQNG